jgi:hypothetical protein
MQHNPSLNREPLAGAAADKLAMDPNAAELDYVPVNGEVLFATALVDPEQNGNPKIYAPTELNVLFVCTFGHFMHHARGS